MDVDHAAPACHCIVHPQCLIRNHDSTPTLNWFQVHSTTHNYNLLVLLLSIIIICRSIKPHSFLSMHYDFSNYTGGDPRVVVSTVAFHARVRGSFPGFGGLKKTKMFFPHPLVKLSIVGGLCDREVAWSASDLISPSSGGSPRLI